MPNEFLKAIRRPGTGESNSISSLDSKALFLVISNYLEWFRVKIDHEPRFNNYGAAMDLTRRHFIQKVSSFFLFSGLFETIINHRATASAIDPLISKWLKNVYELSNLVKVGQIGPEEWQDSMELLLSKIDMRDFFESIDFDRLARHTVLPSAGESFQNVRLPTVGGSGPAVGFYSSLVGFRKDCSIPPHGHRDLVSSFIVLRGEIYGRHYDHREEGKDVFSLKPTIDCLFRQGDWSSVSDQRDNVHWFTARTEGAFMFDIGIRPLSPGKHPSGRFFLDVAGGTLSSQWISGVKSIKPSEAYKKYG